MLEIKNDGHYFIKDAELLPEQNDEFHHLDISKNIINIIENENTPFNIAVVGKWGLGKSSLIKFVTRYFKPNRSDYVIVEINAWKYEKEALRRTFLRQVLMKLGCEDKNAVKKFYDKITRYGGEAKEKDMTFIEYVKEWLPVMGAAFGLYIIGLIFAFIGKGILANVNGTSFTIDKWTSFIFGQFASNIYIPIVTILIQRYIKASSGKYSFQITPPVTTTDEYEEKLKYILKNDNRKIITVIDDLDRLTPAKIVEALDAIKAFVNYDNCIFLVPFDDSILKKALKKKSINLRNNEHLAIESDLFLDKLFQYKIFLPNVVLSNLPKYAVKLARREIPDLRKLCGEELFDRICKEILIHRGVTTPRQVKKILNAFSNNVLLAFRREDEYLDKGTFTSENGFKILAKISVLQADYSEFYNRLFLTTTLIEDFIQLSEKNDIQKVTEVLEAYFNFDKEKKRYKINKGSEGLLNFLKRTSNIKCEDISQYLYLSKDINSILFGDELSRSIRDSVTSGASELVKEKIQDNSNKDLTKLLLDILINAEPYEYDKCVTTLINVYDSFNKYECHELLNLIADKASSVVNNNMEIDHDKINFNNLFSIYLLSDDKSGLGELITRNFEKGSSNYKEKLEIFFENENEFPTNVQESVKNYINSSLGEEQYMNLDDFFNICSLDLNKYFLKYLKSNILFEKVVKYVIENQIYHENNVLIKLFDLYIVHNNINEGIKCMVNYFDDDNFYSLFAEKLEINADKIDIDMGTSVAKDLFQISNEEIFSNINRLLGKMQWHIKECFKEATDNYLLRNYEDKEINAILVKISEDDEIKYIPKTVEKINNTIMENNITYETIEKMQNKYVDNQREDMFKRIKNIISYENQSNDDVYNKVEKLLNILSKYELNNVMINDLITQIYNQTTNYPNDEYVIKSLNLLNTVMNVITKDNYTRFISWASNSSYISSYPVVSISILDIFKEYIEEERYLDIADQLMKYCIIDTLPKALKVLRKLKTKFKTESSQLTNYKNFLLKYVSEKQYRKEIVNDIENEFKSIGNVSSYMINVLKFNDVEEQVIRTSIKFLREVDEPEKEIKKVLNEIDEGEISVLYNIIYSIYEENSFEKINNMVVSINDESNVTYMYNLVYLMLLDEAKYNDKVFASLLVNIFKSADIKIVLRMLDNFSQKRLLKDSASKRKIGDEIYNLFRQTTDTETKLKLYQYVNEMKLKYSFSKDTKKKRDFTEDEKRITNHK